MVGCILYISVGRHRWSILIGFYLDIRDMCGTKRDKTIVINEFAFIDIHLLGPTSLYANFKYGVSKRMWDLLS